MSQQYPEPERTQPGGPQAPYPYPYPYQPPPPVRKRMSLWAIVGISGGSLFAFVTLLAIIGSTADDDKGTVASEAKVVEATVTVTAAGPTATVTVTAKPAEPKKAVAPKPTPSSAPPKPTPPKPAEAPKKKSAPKAKQYGDGDYIVGEDIPPGTYTSKGAAPGLFELCTITTEPTSDAKFPQFKTANAKERVIIMLTKADGVVTVQGCEPLTRR